MYGGSCNAGLMLFSKMPNWLGRREVTWGRGREQWLVALPKITSELTYFGQFSSYGDKLHGSPSARAEFELKFCIIVHFAFQNDCDYLVQLFVVFLSDDN